MHVETRMPFQPCFDLLMFMCAVVVGNQVNLQFLGCLTVNLPEKAQPLTWVCFSSVRLTILPSR